jgi:phosphoribosylformylglycinamidine cyclo-ligase
MESLYAQDGVDVAAGDDFSSFAARVCSATHKNSPFVTVKDFSRGHFRGPRGLQFPRLPPNCYFDVAPDGIGTKTVIITEAMSHWTAACDVLEMTQMDITRWGGLGLTFTSVFDVETLGQAGSSTDESYRQVFLGLGQIANEQGIVLYKGETAELGKCVGSENPKAITKFNWAGFATGVYHESKLITGDRLRPGLVIIALREKGFRSNGISSVRKALERKFGGRWWNLWLRKWWDNSEAAEAIRAAAEPSVMYDRYLSFMNGWYNPGFRQDFTAYLIVHVTGGGIKSKLGEDILFPRGLSAELYDLWEPPQIMRQCAEWRGMSDEECYATWNGGQGALVVVDRKDAPAFIDCAKRIYGIDAKVCGEITGESRPTLTVKSKFNDKEVVYR